MILYVWIHAINIRFAIYKKCEMAKTIQVHDKKFRKIISFEKIQKANNIIANKINKDFKNKKPIFISVLNGSFLFTADLIKKVNIECEISFIKISSYSGTQSTGNMNTLIGLNETLKGRNVVVLDEMVDSGNTIETVITELKKLDPKTLRIATLFFKPDAYTKNIKLDYVGIKVPNDFLVGYGLDYDGLGRNLQDIYVLDK